MSAAPPEEFARAVTEFTRHLRHERGRSAHTVRGYRTDVESLLDHAHRMGVERLADIEVAVLRSWLARRRTTGASRASLARHVAAARAFTAWSHRRGYLPVDPGPRLRGPAPSRTAPQVLRTDQAERLVTAPSTDGSPTALRDKAVLETLYATGIRVSELCGLDLGSVDDSRRVLRVFGKGGKERVVPYGGPAARALDEYLTDGRPGLRTDESPDALFLGARGGRLHPSSARRLLRRWSTEADVPSSTPHDLRHAAATHLLDGGADLRSVQELLGHASIDSTQVYTHVTAERLRGAFKQAHPRA